MSGLFSTKYLLIYMYCALCLYEVFGTLAGVALDAFGRGDLSFFCRYFTDMDYIDSGAGFGRRLFWDAASAVPLSACVVLVRAFAFRRALAASAFLLALSLVPPMVYMLMASGSICGYLSMHHWSSYIFLIVTLVCYLFIVADLIVERARLNSELEER